MRRTILAALIALPALLAGAAAVAGPFEDGKAEFDKGDAAAAFDHARASYDRIITECETD